MKNLIIDNDCKNIIRERIFRTFSLFCKNSFRGSAKEYARRLGVSQSTFFRRLEELRSLGFPIEYNKEGGYYYFTDTINIRISIEIETSKGKTNLI